ncbi:MAG: epoxide hydrolase EphM [Thermoflexibacter sp.]
MPITFRYIPTNGIQLHIAEAGDKGNPVLVLLHGFPEFWYAWIHQIEFFAAQGFHVIAPDQRGYNLSDKPCGVKEYGLDELCKDIIGILDYEKIQKCFLIGHDWGAMVAWGLGMKFPERLYKLGIINVPHPTVMKKSLKNNPIQRKKSSYMFFFQLPWIPEYILGKDNFLTLVKTLKKNTKKGAFTEEELKIYRKAWGQKGALTGMLNWYRGIVRAAPTRGKTNRINIPTHIFWGENDYVLGIDLAEQSLKYLDFGDITFYQATHWIMHEIPEILNPDLLKFLRD